MTATTPIAFDPDPKHLGLVMDFKAGSAILSGQFVGYADAADSGTVIPMTSALGIPLGVALYSADSGARVAVAMEGSILTVMCAAHDTAIEAGQFVRISTVAGTVLEFDPAILGHVQVLTVGKFPVGIALEGTTAGSGTVGSTLKILVSVTPLWSAQS